MCPLRFCDYGWTDCPPLPFETSHGGIHKKSRKIFSDKVCESYLSSAQEGGCHAERPAISSGFAPPIPSGMPTATTTNSFSRPSNEDVGTVFRFQDPSACFSRPTNGGTGCPERNPQAGSASTSNGAFPVTIGKRKKMRRDPENIAPDGDAKVLSGRHVMICREIPAIPSGVETKGKLSTCVKRKRGK